MIRECENCGRIIKGSGRKYCSYCKNSYEVKNKDYTNFTNFNVNHQIRSKSFLSRKAIGVLLFTFLVIIISLFLFNPKHGDNEVHFPELNFAAISCQYNETINTGKVISILYDLNEIKYSNPITIFNVSTSVTNGLGADYNHYSNSEFKIKNNLDKKISLEVFYQFSNNGAISTKNKTLDFPAFSSVFVQERVPNPSSSIIDGSISYRFISNDETRVRTEEETEISCKFCGDKICLNDGEKCQSDFLCGSGICSFGGTCSQTNVKYHYSDRMKLIGFPLIISYLFVEGFLIYWLFGRKS